MKTEDITLFCQLAKYSSQQAAAEALGMQGSTLSRHISKLEQQLGTELIKRNTRPLTLTKSGMELLERGETILLELEALQHSVGNLQSEPEGLVTFAAPLDTIDRVLSNSMLSFKKSYPKIAIKFISYQSREEPSDSLADLTIFICRNNPPDSSMIGKLIVSTNRHFVASPEFIASNSELVHPSQLEDYPCLLTKKGQMPANSWLWQENGQSQIVDVEGVMESESAKLCVSGAVAGLGVAWVPPSLCSEHLESGRLKLLFDGKYATSANIWVLYSRSRYLPYRVRIVLDYLVTELKSSADEDEFYLDKKYYRGLPTTDLVIEKP